MSKIFLHVGLHKTGTTFLQKNIFPNLENTVVYYNKQPVKDKDKDKTVIISEEGFTHSMRRDNKVKWYREYTAKELQKLYGKDSYVILVLRDKKGLVKSLYSQYVKSGGIYRFQRWYNKYFDEGTLDYQHLIDLYNSLFKKLLVLSFEQFKKDKNSFIKNICKFIDKPIPIYQDKIINNSLKGWKMRFIRFVNIFFATPMNPLPAVLPHCMHPRFLFRCCHWKKTQNKKNMMKTMWYPNLKNIEVL